MAKIRAAVVGVGYLGTFHSQKYKTLSEKPDLQVELVAVCDSSQAQAEKVGEDLGVAAFYRAQDLVGKVDAVTIATITPAHYETAKFFLQNNIHVNVEKPICLKVEEARELVELARQKKLILCVGHSERFNPVFRELKSSLQKPLFLEFNRYAPFRLRGSDVSVLHDLMIHDLDLMLDIHQATPKLVRAKAGKVVTKSYDWCSALFEFESGLQCHINCSRVSREMIRSVRAIDDRHVWIANLQTGDLEKTKMVDHAENPVSHEIRNMGRGDNLLAETEAFLRAIQGYPAGAVTGMDGLKALELVEQISAMIDAQKG